MRYLPPCRVAASLPVFLDSLWAGSGWFLRVMIGGGFKLALTRPGVCMGPQVTQELLSENHSGEPTTRQPVLDVNSFKSRYSS